MHVSRPSLPRPAPKLASTTRLAETSSRCPPPRAHACRPSTSKAAAASKGKDKGLRGRAPFLFPAPPLHRRARPPPPRRRPRPALITPRRASHAQHQRAGRRMGSRPLGQQPRAQIGRFWRSRPSRRVAAAPGGPERGSSAARVQRCPFEGKKRAWCSPRGLAAPPRAPRVRFRGALSGAVRGPPCARAAARGLWRREVVAHLSFSLVLLRPTPRARRRRAVRLYPRPIREVSRVTDCKRFVLVLQMADGAAA